MLPNADKKFRLNVSKRDGAVIVSLSGFAELTDTEYFQKTLEDLSAEGGMLLVDLGELNFINSSGLGALVGAHMKSCKSGGTFRIVNPKSAILSVLKVTRLDELFDIRDTLEDAIKG